MRSNVVPIRKEAIMPAPIVIDFHEPLPDYDPNWGAILTLLIALSWIVALFAFSWALT